MTEKAKDPANYWEERLTKQYDLGSVGFQSLGLEFNNAMYRVRARVFRRALRWGGLDPASSKIMDVGSGTGFYVDLWQKSGVSRVVATDVTQVAVDRLRDRFPRADVYRVDIGDELDLPDRGPYDAVSAFDVLFHIVDDDRYARAINNIASVLRPGGLFFVSDNFLHGEPIRTPIQASRSLKDIERVVVEAGFEIVRRAPVFVLMNAPVDAKSIWLKRRWTRLAKRLNKEPQRGARAGRLLYPVEIALTRLFREGPSTEIMICRKR
jgi:SAM-dependent methyltransferase